MRDRFLGSLLLLLPLLTVLGCAYLQPREEVPYSGRKRPPLEYSEEQMAILGAEAYADVLSQYRVIRNTPASRRVTRVGRRLARATGKDYEWEFALLDDPEVVNAFCLPGGKIAVFSGMEQMIENDSDMSVVMGHEIAHAILQHANERMSEPALKQLIGIPTNIVVGVWGTISPGTRKAVMNGLGVGYVVGEALPYDQRHESEADLVGLVFMQRAGYNLDAAPAFWRRMARLSEGRVTDSVSTHPEPERRAKAIERRIEEMRRVP